MSPEVAVLVRAVLVAVAVFALEAIHHARRHTQRRPTQRFDTQHVYTQRLGTRRYQAERSRRAYPQLTPSERQSQSSAPVVVRLKPVVLAKPVVLEPVADGTGVSVTQLNSYDGKRAA